jgi:hypothetical protein
MSRRQISPSTNSELRAQLFQAVQGKHRMFGSYPPIKAGFLRNLHTPSSSPRLSVPLGHALYYKSSSFVQIVGPITTWYIRGRRRGQRKPPTLDRAWSLMRSQLAMQSVRDPRRCLIAAAVKLQEERYGTLQSKIQILQGHHAWSSSEGIITAPIPELDSFCFVLPRRSINHSY